jgi:hypothetical protein
MHQNRPTAPITYLNKKGDTILVEQDTEPKSLRFTLKELAILQTCANRSYYNCNCNLDKTVLRSIIEEINQHLFLFDGDSKNE